MEEAMGRGFLGFLATALTTTSANALAHSENLQIPRAVNEAVLLISNFAVHSSSIISDFTQSHLIMIAVIWMLSHYIWKEKDELIHLYRKLKRRVKSILGIIRFVVSFLIEVYFRIGIPLLFYIMIYGYGTDHT